MARFALVALCVMATLGGALADGTPLDYGMTMSSRAYGAVCWYENLKQFPNTNSKQYGQCSSTADQLQKQMENPSEQNQKYFKTYPEKKATFYGDSMTKMAISKIPKEYQSACEKYLKDPGAEPAANEGEALNDQGADYPFKAFSYCMMQTLRKKHGDEAIEAVKNERTVKHKNWMQTLLDRENEFRGRHGVEPLKIVKDLNDAAQQWAEDNAAKCKMYHSENKDPGRQWRGDGTGESLSSGGGDDNNRDAAYGAADGWYEEIQDYPYPEYTGDGTDAQFMKIGHFTQSVWKGSKYVGYGYAYNPDCPTMKRYVAARYSPPGNMKGAYGANVNPPK